MSSIFMAAIGKENLDIDKVPVEEVEQTPEEAVGLDQEQIQTEIIEAEQVVEANNAELADAEHKLDSLETIEQGIENSAPALKDDEGNDVIDEETGEVVKDLDAEMPINERIAYTATATLVGDDIEPKDAIGEVALATDEEGVVTKESLNSVTYRAAMEGVGTILSNVFRELVKFFGKIIEGIKILFSKIFNSLPGLKKNFAKFIGIIDTYQKEGRSPKEETFTVKNKMNYMVDHRGVKNSSEVLEAVKKANGVVNNVNSNNANSLDFLFNEIKTTFSVAVSCAKALSSSMVKKAGGENGVITPELNTLIESFKKSATNLDKLLGLRITDGKIMFVLFAPVTNMDISLGGFTIGSKEGKGLLEVYNKAKEALNNLQSLDQADLSNRRDEMLDLISKYMEGIKYIVTSFAGKIQNYPSFEAPTISCFSLGDLKNICIESERLVDSLIKYQKGSYVSGRNKVLAESTRISKEFADLLDKTNNIPQSLNKIMKDGLNSCVKDAENKIKIPLGWGTTTAKATLSIVAEHLGKYGKPESGNEQTTETPTEEQAA